MGNWREIWLSCFVGGFDTRIWGEEGYATVRGVVVAIAVRVWASAKWERGHERYELSGWWVIC